MNKSIRNSIFLLSLTLLLAACGGGEASSSVDPSSSASETSASDFTSSSEDPSTSDAASSSEDPTAFTSRNVSRVLRGLEEVAIKGELTYRYRLSALDVTETYEYETEGYWSGDLVYMRSQDKNQGNLGLDTQIYRKSETGGCVVEYLDRDNAVKTVSDETVKFSENFVNPFSTFPTISIQVDTSTYIATVNTDQYLTYFINLMWLTINMGFDSYYEPDFVQVSFTKDLVPYRMYAHGQDTSLGESEINYYGEFVSKEDLHEMVIPTHEKQEGQEPLGEMFKALQEATSYSASLKKTYISSDGNTETSASLIVDESKGVVETSSEGIAGTYASEGGYYEINGGEGAVATASSTLKEGKAFNAYFSNTHYGDITPDFAYSETHFTVNEDGSFTLDDPYTYQQVEYMMPDNAWNTFTGRTSGYVYPLCTNIDDGSLVISGSVAEGIKIAYTAESGSYSMEIVISEIGTAVYPYTSITPLAE